MCVGNMVNSLNFGRKLTIEIFSSQLNNKDGEIS